MYPLTITTCDGKYTVGTFDGTATTKIDISRSDLAYPDGNCRHQEKSKAGTDWVKVMDLTANSTYQRVNILFNVQSRNNSCLLNVSLYTTADTKLILHTLGYVPIAGAANIIDRLVAGFTSNTTGNTFQMW